MGEKRLRVTDFHGDGDTVWNVTDVEALMGCESGQGARACLDGNIADQVEWERYGYLVLDVKSEQDWSLVFQFEIWEKGNDTETPDLTVRFSMIPREDVRLALPFSALDAQHIFLKRTPGKLRSFVTGRAVKPENIGKFAIGLRKGWERQRITVKNMVLQAEEPDYPFEGKKLVDMLGQKKLADWTGKCVDEADMVRRIMAEKERLAQKKRPAGRSSYGGWQEMRFEATGYFRLEKTDTHWWLVDPEGYAFLTAGMDCLRVEACTPVEGLEDCYDWLPDRSGTFEQAWMGSWWDENGKKNCMSFSTANLIRCFGENWREEWEKLTAARLRDWGFNTIGAFSDEQFVRNSKMPYTHALMGYPFTKKKIYRDFPDVFSDEFHRSAEQYAAQLESRLTDDNMIGYYMRNEPEWAFAADVCLAEELLADTEPTATRREMMNFLKERYGQIDGLNEAWGIRVTDFEELERTTIEQGRKLSARAAADLDDFSAVMIREYVKVPALALKAVDPNHLNLGMRYAFILYPNQAAGCEYMDIFSINCYQIDPSAILRKVADIVKMPVMIGEYHFGALDRGLEATGIIGVESQEDRGKAYRYYMNHALSVPECVGVQYFEYNDQSLLGRPDGENYQIGFVDVCQTPYAEMVEAARWTHEHMYAVADGREDYESSAPVKIISNIAS